MHLALGAARASLGRVALFEGAFLIGLAAATAGVLTLIGLGAFSTYLHDRMRFSANPIDFDRRTFLFMVAGGAVPWLLVSLPGVVYASRSNLMGLLKQEDRGSGVSRSGALLRRVLTVTEVALAVLLVIGGALYLQSYQKLLAIDKGIDTTNLVEVNLTLPNQFYPSYASKVALAEELIQGAKRLPGVLAAAHGSAPPSTGDSRTSGQKLEIDGRPPLEEPIALATRAVDPAFLKVLGLPLKSGRMFEPGEPPTNVIVPEAFARRFWPDGQAVGHTFRPSPQRPVYFVIGVIGDFRVRARSLPQPADQTFFVYSLKRPPPPPTTQPATVDTGGSYGFVDVTMRLDSRDRAASVLDVARKIDPRIRTTLEFADDMYANQHSDVLLTTRVVGAFGMLAFLVAIVGVYGVMVFLVAGRTREIGIRMALGADRGDISRLVVGSATRLVATGVIVGVVGARAASRWVTSQFFGITATEPVTYLVVAGVVLIAAILATWRPARQAARVDPAITLRGE